MYVCMCIYSRAYLYIYVYVYHVCVCVYIYRFIHTHMQASIFRICEGLVLGFGLWGILRLKFPCTCSLRSSQDHRAKASDCKVQWSAGPEHSRCLVRAI